MARDGSGNYSRVEGPYVNGTIADADEVNNELDDIATALSDSVNKNGTKAFAADQSMGGFKLTNLAAPSGNNDAARKAYVDSTVAAASFQPLDATLTAFAALSWSSGKPLVQFTAADTVSLTLTPELTSVLVGAGSASAPSLSFSGDPNTGFYNNTADQMAVALGGAAKWVWIGSGFVTNDQPNGYIGSGNGSAASPSLTFISDSDNGFYRIGANQMGLALGGTKYIDFLSTLIDISAPTRAKIAVSSETSGTLTAASSNKKVNASGNITIDGNVHAADDQMKIYAGASARTLTQGATGTPTQRLHGSSTTGNLTLAARGVAVVDFISATEWVVSGDVS